MANAKVALVMSAHFDEAIARFDAAHAEDPEKDASGQPAELVYAQRMSAWLAKLAPYASEALSLAVRCQHIRRWVIRRSDNCAESFHQTTLRRPIGDMRYPCRSHQGSTSWT